ncbi:MAG TPA: hypothetical protein VHZ55_33640 [Bryobacteraceae bacterium]|nr:hypothetical protein [Bryobacteraceae bacterium]
MAQPVFCLVPRRSAWPGSALLTVVLLVGAGRALTNNPQEAGAGCQAVGNSEMLGEVRDYLGWRGFVSIDVNEGSSLLEQLKDLGKAVWPAEFLKPSKQRMARRKEPFCCW